MFDSIAELARGALSGLRRSGRERYLVGVAGPPGAGKSTLVEALIRACREELGEGHAIGLPMDGFHLTNRQLSAAGIGDRKGAPETFDAESFAAALKQLAEMHDSALSWPKYSRQLHEPIADAITVPPTAELVFVEGNYLLLDEEPWRAARRSFDSTWYVAADMATIRERLRRRQLEGGKTEAEADRHVLESDLVNAERVEATRPLADRVVEISPDDPMLTDLRDPATGRPIQLR